MPTRRAALAFSAVACIILPVRVEVKNAVKRPMQTSAPASTTSCWGTRMRPPMVMAGVATTGGNGM
jgi:hypothetical protein